jgi:uncharacterized protein (DUF362 family)
MTGYAFADSDLDISVAKGNNAFNNTTAAVKLLGGIEKFVSGQTRVGLLINSPWKHPGSYVNPDISLAVVRMCLDAGAKEVGVFKDSDGSYWRRSAFASAYSDEIRQLKDYGGSSIKVNIPKGISLKDASVARKLLECDVFINISIAKDHTGTRFSGTMKNMMGASSFLTNQYFHHGSGSIGSYGDVTFLSQCIADLNLARKPDLCILDGTKVLKTNGPAGPGTLLTPQKIIVGTNPVSVDAYGADMIGVNPDEVLMIQKGQAHGLGEAVLARLNIREVAV